jgi:transposase-like protein
MSKQHNRYQILETLQYWFNDTNREDSINRINNSSLSTFADNIGVSFYSLRRFLIKNNINVKIKNRNKKVNAKTKHDIVLLAKKIGAVKASKECNISTGTIYNWAKQINIDISQCRKGVPPKCYSDIEKENAVQLAIKYGLPEAAKRTNISKTSIWTWVSEFGVHDLIILKRGNYDDNYKSKIIEEAYKNGITSTSVKYHISTRSIRSWINKDSEETGREYFSKASSVGRRDYDEETKLKAIELANEIGVRSAACKLSISSDAIYRWRRQYRNKTIKKEGGTV